MNRRRASRRGQALVEFALVIPLMLILAFALVDFARGIFIYSVISSAAREGARYAIVHGNQGATPVGVTPVILPDNPPQTGPGTTDQDGTIYVVPKTRELAFGLDQSALRVGVCWGDGCTISPDCATSHNEAQSAIPDVPVTVRTCYAFQPITASFLRLGSLGLAAQATLTVTH
jgi:hypothetical protein